MSSLFSPDSRFMQAASRTADLMILNFLFLLTSLPVFTIGASLTALYRVVFFMGTAQEGSATAEYFRAFRANFKQATKVWLTLFVVLLAVAMDYLLFLPFGVLPQIVFGILALLTLAVLGYAFPLVSFFENSVVGTIKNALIFSLGSLPRTILVLALNLLPWVLLALAPLYFFAVGLIWLVIYFSAAAYLNSLLLRPVFRPYLPEDTLKQEEKV